MSGLRGLPGGAPPCEEGDAAAYNAPVLRKNAWLGAHPGGDITWPARGWPFFTAGVADTLVATATVDGGLEELMDNVDEAESEGRCPLHTPAGRHPRAAPPEGGEAG